MAGQSAYVVNQSEAAAYRSCSSSDYGVRGAVIRLRSVDGRNSAAQKFVIPGYLALLGTHEKIACERFWKAELQVIALEFFYRPRAYEISLMDRPDKAARMLRSMRRAAKDSVAALSASMARRSASMSPPAFDAPACARHR